jgi:hypothetical protein
MPALITVLSSSTWACAKAASALAFSATGRAAVNAAEPGRPNHSATNRVLNTDTIA